MHTSGFFKICCFIVATLLSVKCFGLEWRVPDPQNEFVPASQFLKPVTNESRSEIVAQIGNELVNTTYLGGLRWRVKLAEANTIITVSEIQAQPQGYLVLYAQYSGETDTTLNYLAFISGDLFPAKVKWRYAVTPDAVFIGPGCLGLRVSAVCFNSSGKSSALAAARVGLDQIDQISGSSSFRLLMGRRNGQLKMVMFGELQNEVRWEKPAPSGAIRFAGNPLNYDANIVVTQNSNLEYGLSSVEPFNGTIRWTSNVAGIGTPNGLVSIQRVIGSEMVLSAEMSSGAWFATINPDTGAFKAQRRWTDASPQFTLTSSTVLVRRSIAGGEFWALLDLNQLQELWRRPIETRSQRTQEFAFNISNRLVILRAAPDFGRFQYSEINVSSGNTLALWETPHAPATANTYGLGSTKIYGVSMIEGDPAPVLKPFGNVRVEIFDRSFGARNSIGLINFVPQQVAIAGDDLLLASSESLANTDTKLRVIRVGPSGAAFRIFDQSFERPGLNTISLIASAQQVALLLRSANTCAQSRLISINPLSGALIWERDDLGITCSGSAIAAGANILLSDGSNMVLLNGQTGATLWTKSVGVAVALMAFDPLHNSIWVSGRFPSSLAQQFDTRVLQLNATTAALNWSQDINLGVTDRPQALKILSDGAALLRIRASVSPNQGVVHLLRLNALNGSTQFNFNTLSANLPIWDYLGFLYEEVGNEIWISGELNIGYDESSGEFARVPITRRLDAQTGQRLGSHWWSLNQIRLPEYGAEYWYPALYSPSSGNFRFGRVDTANFIRRSDEFRTEAVDLAVQTSVSRAQILGDMVRFQVTVTNLASATADPVQLQSVHEGGQEHVVRATQCDIPTSSCAESGFPTLSLQAGASVTFEAYAKATIGGVDLASTTGRFAIVAIPRKEQLELYDANNLATLEITLGPFQNGFE